MNETQAIIDELQAKTDSLVALACQIGGVEEGDNHPDELAREDIEFIAASLTVTVRQLNRNGHLKEALEGLKVLQKLGKMTNYGRKPLIAAPF